MARFPSGFESLPETVALAGSVAGPEGLKTILKDAYLRVSFEILQRKNIEGDTGNGRD